MSIAMLFVMVTIGNNLNFIITGLIEWETLYNWVCFILENNIIDAFLLTWDNVHHILLGEKTEQQKCIYNLILFSLKNVCFCYMCVEIHACEKARPEKIYTMGFRVILSKLWASLVAQRLKHLTPMQETWVRSLGWEDPLEKEMATHSSILAWRISWTEEPGRLQSTGSLRIGHGWATSFPVPISV